MVDVSVSAFVMFVFLQGAFEKVFSFWPLSKCFELNGNVYEWWFRWKLDRYVCTTYRPLYCTIKCIFFLIGKMWEGCFPFL